MVLLIVFLSLSGFLLLLVIGLLLIPVRLQVDTDHGLYRIDAGHIAEGRVVGPVDDPGVSARLLWMHWEFRLLEFLAHKEIRDQTADQTADDPGPEPEKKPKRKPRKKSGGLRTDWRSILNMIRAGLGSFQVRRFHLEVDTDNWTTNAYLFPLAAVAQYRGLDASVNFEGHTCLQLDVRNRPGRIGWALLKTYLTRR